MAERECPRCGRPQPETAAGGKCLFCGENLPWAAATIPPPPAQDLQPADGSEPEKRPCPSCGESLYATERRCWRCGHEFEEMPEAEPEPPAAPAETPIVPPPVASVPPPAIPSTTPYYPTTAAPAPTGAEKQAQVLGLWSLVVGILGLFCCLGLTGVIAIYLGVRSNRLAKNGLATAGIVLGIIGLVEFFGVLLLGVVGYFVEQAEGVDTSALHHLLAPAVPCALALLRPFLSL
ncbi:MAG: DUF4190 domain-containing protein [Armatimonadota bacterium]